MNMQPARERGAAGAPTGGAGGRRPPDHFAQSRRPEGRAGRPLLGARRSLCLQVPTRNREASDLSEGRRERNEHRDRDQPASQRASELNKCCPQASGPGKQGFLPEQRRRRRRHQKRKPQAVRTHIETKPPKRAERVERPEASVKRVTHKARASAKKLPLGQQPGRPSAPDGPRAAGATRKAPPSGKHRTRHLSGAPRRWRPPRAAPASGTGALLGRPANLGPITRANRSGAGDKSARAGRAKISQ